MKQADVKHYKGLLMTERDQVLLQSRHREDIRIVRSNDELERMQLAGEREFAVRTLERATGQLWQIVEALKRIDNGEFGVCVDCEEPISPKRLAAVPWAAYCLHCQEQDDLRQADVTFRSELAA